MALTEFAHASRSTYQGRLFAQDALEGLRLIDLTRERFDAVVMNPPFGAPSAGARTLINHDYACSKNDWLTIFAERGISVIRQSGYLGAITSRTCFFLSSFQKWRESVVLKYTDPRIVADLGFGIMDDAVVEPTVRRVAQRSAGESIRRRRRDDCGARRRGGA